jgi:hypothetical protein
MLGVMKRWHTGIRAFEPIAPTAIQVDAATPGRPLVVDDHGGLADIVLPEADTARRAARWLRGTNYLNLGLSLVLFFMTIEISDHAPALSQYALALWFLLDFMPVALVFAGGQRLKRLKCLPLVWTGAACMLYLALERLAAASMLVAFYPALPNTIPAPNIVWGCGIAMLLVNALAALATIRLLTRPEFRAAFR